MSWFTVNQPSYVLQNVSLEWMHVYEWLGNLCFINTYSRSEVECTQWKYVSAILIVWLHLYSSTGTETSSSDSCSFFAQWAYSLSCYQTLHSQTPASFIKDIQAPSERHKKRHTLSVDLSDFCLHWSFFGKDVNLKIHFLYTGDKQKG